MALTLLALVGGIVMLAYAADQFVIGAARVALLRRISPLVVGVVVVGFGTSAPEMLVSGLAAADGKPQIAVGNVVGSNLANLSLLLGIGALIVPLAVDSRTVRREAPMVVGAMIVFALAVQGNRIGPLDGLLLLPLMAATLFLVMKRGGSDALAPDVVELADTSGHRLPVEVLRTAAGLVGTVAGAQLLLWAAIDIADRAGLGEGFVGATLVAIGTSLPELVTVIQSARRGETDLIVGNLLGSNLFNALGVGAIIGLFGSGRIDDPALTRFGVIAAIAVAAAAMAAMYTGRTVSRREGGALVVGYLAIIPFLS